DFKFDTVNTFFGNQVFNPASTGCPHTASPQDLLGNSTVTVDCSGFGLPRAPEWAGTASYDHTLGLTNGGELNAMISAFFASRRWANFDFVATELQPSYVVFDFDLSYTTPSANWTLSGYIHNLSNENVYLGGGEQAFAPPLVYASVAPPR